jgi:hypothetical protein
VTVSACVLGVYRSPDQAIATVRALRARGFDRITAYSPTPHHALEEAVGAGVSPVRYFVLAGGLLGCVLGFALPIYTVSEWPLITGGKALASIPPFVIIAFELTILLGALSGVLGFLILAHLPRLRENGMYDARFTQDRYGVQVSCSPDQVRAAEVILAGEGAEEVRHDA